MPRQVTFEWFAGFFNYYYLLSVFLIYNPQPLEQQVLVENYLLSAERYNNAGQSPRGNRCHPASHLTFDSLYNTVYCGSVGIDDAALHTFYSVAPD